MFTRIAPENSARVLAVVPAAQFPGRAVVDLAGLAPKSFATWDLRFLVRAEERAHLFERHLVRSLRRYRPSILVLGISRFDDPISSSYRQKARQLATSRCVPVVELHVAQARELLLGCQRGSRDDALADKVVAAFFPELSSFQNAKQTIRRRYRLHGFEPRRICLHGCFGCL